jgi:hypothetical protein
MLSIFSRVRLGRPDPSWPVPDLRVWIITAIFFLFSPGACVQLQSFHDRTEKERGSFDASDMCFTRQEVLQSRVHQWWREEKRRSMRSTSSIRGSKDRQTDRQTRESAEGFSILNQDEGVVSTVLTCLLAGLYSRSSLNTTGQSQSVPLGIIESQLRVPRLHPCVFRPNLCCVDSFFPVIVL